MLRKLTTEDTRQAPRSRRIEENVDQEEQKIAQFSERFGKVNC